MSTTDLIERSREMCARMVGTMDWHTAVALVDALAAAENTVAELKDYAARTAEHGNRVIEQQYALTEQLAAAQAVIAEALAIYEHWNWNDFPSKSDDEQFMHVKRTLSQYRP